MIYQFQVPPKIQLNLSQQIDPQFQIQYQIMIQQNSSINSDEHNFYTKHHQQQSQDNSNQIIFAKVLSNDYIMLCSIYIQFYGKTCQKMRLKQIWQNKFISLVIDKQCNQQDYSKIRGISKNQLNMMNYMEYIQIKWMKYNQEAELLIELFQQKMEQTLLCLNMNGQRSVKLYHLIKFTSRQKKQEQRFIAVFNTRNQITYDIINNFCIRYIHSKMLKSKLSMIKLYKQFNLAFWKYDQQKDHIVVYGILQQVIIIQDQINEQLKSIKLNMYKKEADNIINNVMFAYKKSLAESLGFLKIQSHQRQIYLFFYQNLAQILQESHNFKVVIFKDHIKELFLKDPKLQKLKNNNPQLFRINLNDRDVLVGTEQMMDKIESLVRIRKRSGQNSNRNQHKNSVNNIIRKSKQKNIQINQENYQQIFKYYNDIKIIQKMPFKIDFVLENKNMPEIRISNTVRNFVNIFLIFNNYSEIIKLQTIIQDHIDLWKIQQVCQKFDNSTIIQPIQLKTNNNQARVFFYPHQNNIPNQDILISLLSDYSKLSSYNSAILCTNETLKTIFHKYSPILKGSYTFSILAQVPNLHNIPLLLQNKVLMQMNQTTDKQFKQSTQNEEFQKLNSIMKKYKCEYSLGQYVLSQIDNYNICMMIVSQIDQIYLILSNPPQEYHDNSYSNISNKPGIDRRRNNYKQRNYQDNRTQQFIYLIYHQKLLRVHRQKNGQFSRLSYSATKQLQKYKGQLRYCYRRAFNIGQKYISIRVPFEHIKLTKISEITQVNKHKKSNRNLLAYYGQYYQESSVYKVQKLSDCQKIDERCLEQNLKKRYKLWFNDPKIKKMIRQTNLGYGYFRKWQENGYYYFEADQQIFLKMIKYFEQYYQQLDSEQQKLANLKKQQAQISLAQHKNMFRKKK